MVNKKALIASVVLNSVFAVVLARVYGELREARMVIAAGEARTQQFLPLAPTRLGILPAQDGTLAEKEIRADFDRAKAAGESNDVALRMLAASVLELMPKGLPDSYWQPPARREFERQVSAFQQYEAARALVLRIAGPSVADEKAFEFLYKPLNDRLPFLSSAKQILVQKIRIDAQRELLAGSGAPSRLGLGPNTNKALADDLRKVLTSGEYFEYQVRESAAAQMLAAVSFEFTEQEFRKIFRIVERDSSSRPFVGSLFGVVGQSGSSSEVQAEVMAVLGPARFEEFRRAQDPAYKLLRSIAGANGLPVEIAARAHDVLASASRRVTKIRMSGPLFTGAQREQVRMIIQERDKELKNLLGERGFEDFERHPGSSDARLGMSLTVPARLPIEVNR